MATPTKTPSTSTRHQSSAAATKSRFEAYNRLQAAAVAFGEKLPIPEIVALGGQSDGKSSLLEALLGFRFNVRDVESSLLRLTGTAVSPKPIVMRAEVSPATVDRAAKSLLKW